MKKNETIFVDGMYRKIWINNDGYKSFKLNNKKILLHRYLYEQENGEIPEGYVIHHANFNKLINDLDNLKCMSIGKHSKLHNKGRKLSDEHIHKMSISQIGHTNTEKYLYTIYNKTIGYIYGHKKPQKFYKKFANINAKNVQNALNKKDNHLFVKGNNKGLYIERVLKNMEEI